MRSPGRGGVCRPRSRTREIVAPTLEPAPPVRGSRLRPKATPSIPERGITSAGGDADAQCGMQGTATPTSEWGSGDARLHADILSLGRLDPDRESAAARLQTALGDELAQRLVSALARGARRCVNAAA